MRSEGERLKFIKPQEPRLVLEPPVSDDWLHEIKFDGFRVQLILDWAGARTFTGPSASGQLSTPPRSCPPSPSSSTAR